MAYPQIHQGFVSSSIEKTMATKTYWGLGGNGGMGWLLAVIMDRFPIPMHSLRLAVSKSQMNP
jgi:hypothetical protein